MSTRVNHERRNKVVKPSLNLKDEYERLQHDPASKWLAKADPKLRRPTGAEREALRALAQAAVNTFQDAGKKITHVKPKAEILGLNDKGQ
jgi:hypothetical protein